MRFKSQLIIRLFFASLFSIVLFIAYVFDALLSDSLQCWPILAIGIPCIWSLYLLLTICSLSMFITNERIVAKRFGREKWRIEKSEIAKIEYTGWFLWALFWAADSAAEVRIHPKPEAKQKLLDYGLAQKGHKYFIFGATKRQIEKMKKLGFDIVNI